jgi:hypothetical protein
MTEPGNLLRYLRHRRASNSERLAVFAAYGGAR